MAIRWVQDNIEHFGGNSQSITIFGESAGAVSVGLLCLMPINKGLFQRAIQQSGTAYVPRLSVSSTKSLSRLGTKLNCPFSNTTLLVQCMKGLSADLFLTLDWDMLYSPVVDGELLTDVPINLLDDVNSEANLFFQSITPKMFDIVLNPSNSHYLIPQSIISFRNRITATKFGPSCYQTLGMEKDLLQNQNISEDCLHLNIFLWFFKP
jgi:carboxylesterase type B